MKKKRRNNKNVFYLNGEWKLTYTEYGFEMPEYFKYKATVPGDVHLDLLKYNEIPDPFVGDNYKKCYWMEDKDWWYYKEFTLPEHFKKYNRLELVFDSIDTIATVWLNNYKLGRSDNMFIPVKYDIKDKVKFKEKNQLVVRIHSINKELQNSKYKDQLTDLMKYRLFVRKASYNFGWDIAPRLLSTGIFKDVKIIGQKSITIEDIYIKTDSIEKDFACLSIEITLINNTLSEQKIFVALSVKNTSKKIVFKKRLKDSLTLKKNVIKTSFVIKSPDLWYPAGSGKQSLYTLEVLLKNKDEELDLQKKIFGIRIIKLVQEKQDDGGISFYFKVNDRKIFIKGVNWVPLDALPARITKERYKKVLSLAKEQNLNCIRIWGGGFYEDDFVYDYCDKNGLLIWQDFMFACAMVPQDNHFLEKIWNEAEFIIKRLRTHPSLMLWCGDNEVDMSFTWQKKEEDYEIPSNKVSLYLLPILIQQLSPDIPYIPSSPFSITQKNPGSSKEGDNHLWYHGTDYKDKIYSDDTSRFVSEIGHLSIPCLDSAKKFIPEKYLWPPDNSIWDEHFGSHFDMDFHPHRREKMEEAIFKVYGYIPETIEEYIEMSQNLQKDALIYWINHYKECKYCGGIIYWNLIDCWPQFSDSVIDYYLKPKKAYEAIKEIFKKIC